MGGKNREIEAKETKLKKLVIMLMALTLAALMAAPIAAETEIDISGQVRVRGELDAKPFDTSRTTSGYTLMRTRVLSLP